MGRLAREAGMARKAILLLNVQKAHLLAAQPHAHEWRRWLLRGVLSGLVAETVFLPNGSGEEDQTAAAVGIPKRPNIVVILTDDQRMDDLRVMKHVNALLANDGGVSFSNFFVSNSLCCPSRATFLTGKYSHNHGVMTNVPGYTALDDHRNTLGVWLQHAGYYTGYIGKYMNGYGMDDADEVPGAPPHEVAPGWNDWHALGMHSGYFSYLMNENGSVNTYGTTTANDPDVYVTDVLTNKAVDFIHDRATSSDPFFLMIGEKSPHLETAPYRIEEEKDDLNILQAFLANNPPAAPRDEGRFANEPLPPTRSFNERALSDKPNWIRLFPLMRAKEIAAVTEVYRNRLESLLSVDDGVATIMAALQQTGKLDHTVVIVTSDNGFMLGEHRIPVGKDLLYEESAHQPFIMKIPWMSGSRTINQLVVNVDIAPTLLELAGGAPCAIIDGVSTCRDLDGRSFLPLIADDNTPWRTAVLLEAIKYAAVRTNDYVYGVWSSGEKELYNFTTDRCHDADPDEMDSQHNNACYKVNGTISTLQGILEILKTCSGATCWQ